ncbi:MAG: hypothetical protein IPJ81_17755 [Chitinophagaceae bacterium]|nr:hypothetical protein [Chitinophagaceae bacterium]
MSSKHITKKVDIVKIIYDLKNKPGSQTLGCWLEGDTPAEVENYNFFQDCKKQLIAEFGIPTYEGIGPQAGYEKAKPKHWIIEYNNSLDLAWWEKDSYTIFLMLTGHDANTLFCLTAAVSEYILPANNNLT